MRQSPTGARHHRTASRERAEGGSAICTDGATSAQMTSGPDQPAHATPPGDLRGRRLRPQALTATEAAAQQLADDARAAPRIDGDVLLGPSWFRHQHVDRHAEAARSWLHEEAEVIDTTALTPGQVARQVAAAVDR
jgi:hypothetical protein